MSENAVRNKALREAPIEVPVLAIGGEVGSSPGLLEDMRPYGVNVTGGVISGTGHYIPEEKPHELVQEINAFAERIRANP